MTVKYWAGSITPEIIKSVSHITWAAGWLHRAKVAEQAGNELIVLEIPKGAVIDDVVTVEQSLEMFLRLDAG